MSNWEKKYHVESSMPNDPKGFHAFLGRWQPLHEGHQQLFQQVLENGCNVLIMIRDIEPNEKNPFTAEQVKENIIKHYYGICDKEELGVKDISKKYNISTMRVSTIIESSLRKIRCGVLEQM